MYLPFPRAAFINRNESGQRFVRLRDKDIPGLVSRVGGLGLLGSDAWLTQKRSVRERLLRQPVAKLGVRFAFAAPVERVAQVEDKLADGRPLRVAALYRELAYKVLGPGTQVFRPVEGGLEAMPTLFPDLDGTFDLVESGQTVRANGLVIVRDNLVPVTLDVVWLADPQSVTIPRKETE